MRNIRYIGVLILASLLFIPAYAQKKEKKEAPKQTISVEQEQQFTYYWYAAKQAIVEERYGDAYVLLKFCDAIYPNNGATMCFLGIIEQGIGNDMRGLLYLRDAFEADPYDQWYQYTKALKELDSPIAKGEILRVLEKAHEVQKRADEKNKGQDPKIDEDLLSTLQTAYLQTGQWQKALEIQDEIDGLKGYDAYSAILRYRVYDAINKPKKALAEVNRYLEQDPTDERFLLFKLELLEKTKANKKELYALCEKVLEIDPYNLMVLNNYAYYLATHKGDLQKAERMSAITIQQEPDNPVFLDTYGWILHLQGQNELAYFYLKKAQWNETDETRDDIRQHLEAVKKEVHIYEQ